MADNISIHKHVGRNLPARGVHYSHSGPNIIWTTVCTEDRKEWLTPKLVMESLHDIWLMEATAWLVSDYLLMPDHVHFFGAPHNQDFTIENWFRFWKDRLTKRMRDSAHPWQIGGFHHRIRSASEYTEKWNYMMANPVRKNLVTTTEDWPWKRPRPRHPLGVILEANPNRLLKPPLHYRSRQKAQTSRASNQ